MRIGVDAFNLAADRRGMGRIVRNTLQSLVRTGETGVVLVARDAAKARALSDRYGLPAVAVREVRAAGFDAVWYPWNGMRFEPHAPAIVTINDPFAFTYPHSNPIARWREQAPVRRAIRKADRIFTISEWGAAELTRLFGVGRERLAVAPPPLDDFWKPVVTPSRSPYVLFVAGPDRRKNAAMLFSSFDAEFGAASSPALVVAGTLSDEDEKAFASMRAPRERVQPDDETLRELYSGALAVAVPSLAEGYGMPVVEAMACGAPVVSSDATALPEACGDAALLVPPRDADAWRAALRRISEDDALRQTLRREGLRRVQRIDPEGCARALLASARQLREAVR